MYPFALDPAGPDAAAPVQVASMRLTAARPVRLGPAAAGRCRRRVHLDSDPGADRGARAPMDDGFRLRLAEGDAHRTRVLSMLAQSFGPGHSHWRPTDPQRPAVLYAPTLTSPTRVGNPDVLLWAGDGYLPVLIRGHRTTDPGAGALTSAVTDPLLMAADPLRRARVHQADALALAHHYRLLTELGLASPRAIGGVIGRGFASVETPSPGKVDGPGRSDDQTILWHQLDLPDGSVLADYDSRFTDRLAVAAAALNGRPALALPSKIGECRRCSWWPLCHAELTAGHDISLLTAGSDAEVLLAFGVRTIDDLAAVPNALVASLPLTSLDRGTARVRARAWLAGTPLVRKVAAVAVPRADLELDVDMESYLEDGAYLWGAYLSGPGVERLGLASGYTSFVSWRQLPDADEGRAFAEFWAYLTMLRTTAAAHGLSFAAYCYSRTAEERWLRSTPRRYPAVPGMPTLEEINRFCSSAQWVDIYQQLRDQFVIPGSMKLKALAPLAGFGWRDAEPGGENSMAWYRSAVGVDGAGVDPQIFHLMSERILQYNEDDVLATLALRRWITDSATTVPTVAELDAD